MKFWKERDENERSRTQERIRQRAMEKIGRMGIGKVSTKSDKGEIKKSKSPGRGRSTRRSDSQSSESRSRSRSPPRWRERSYSISPSRRKRPYSKSPSRSISRSPSPRRRGSRSGHKDYSPSPPRGPPGRGSSMQDTSTRIPAIYPTPEASYPPAQLQYPPQNFPWQPQQVYPAGSGMYTAAVPPPWSQQGIVPSSVPQTQGQIGQQSQNSNRYPARGGYGRQSDTQSRNWR